MNTRTPNHRTGLFMTRCWQRDGIPFGMRDGNPCDVMQVERGKKCACICPACNAPLIAKKGLSGKQRHHFAHASGNVCANGLETSVHQAAKYVVCAAGKVMVPGSGPLDELRSQPDWSNYAQHPSAGESWLFPPEVRTFRRVELEKQLSDSITGKSVKPDLVCDGELLVEFFVSHQVDEEKRTVLVQLGKPCLEVDLRPFIRAWLDDCRSKDAKSAMAQLQDFLLDSSEDRKWIYDRRVPDWLEAHRKPEFPAINGQQMDLLPEALTALKRRPYPY